MASITFEIDNERLWSSVFGANPETFGDWWSRFRFIKGEWDEVGEFDYGIDNPNNDEVIYGTLNIDQLAKGYSIVASKYPHLADLDNQDSISSDAILQCSILGDIVYG